MKTTLNTYQIADALHRDEYANWTYAGAKALAEYLEEMEESTGEEMELDVVAIRCDFAQYDSLEDWAMEYFGGPAEVASQFVSESLDDEELAEAIRSYIQDNGQLIEFDGGIIVSCF